MERKEGKAGMKGECMKERGKKGEGRRGGEMKEG